ncbi:MAG: PadR family transcriptional regulator, partial [Acetatifactor sp.]|nr:PadR family transcriptional regulator [Acetatifactor sp.]
MLKHGILGLINYREMTGYEIMRTFRDSLNFFWEVQTSQIYRELQTLESKGWVDKT